MKRLVLAATTESAPVTSNIGTDLSVPDVSIGVNFTGPNYHTDPGIVVTPPDTEGAVGNGFFAQLLNNLYSVYDDVGDLLLQERITDFWTNAGATFNGLQVDPRIVYDPVSQRWFASSAYGVFSPTNGLLLAVSDSPDPTKGWTSFNFPTDPSSGTWVDFPMLGVNQDGVYLSANQWDLSTGTPVGTEFLSVPKSDLLAAAPTAANASVFTSIEPAIGQYPHPVVAYGTSGSEAIISRIQNPMVQISSVDSPASGATLNVSDRQFTIPAMSDAVAASQKGTNVLLDLRANSQFGATQVMADGMLFAIRAVQLANGFDGIAWYVIGDPLGSPTLLSTGAASACRSAPAGVKAVVQ